jgi:glycosyltransferase involved in cell wall biosynthesis
MKIFFYYPGYLNLDRGSPNRARNIVNWVSRKEDVILSAYQLTSKDILSNVKFFRLKRYNYLTGLNFIFKIIEVRNIIKITRPDIIYGFTNNSVLVLTFISKLLRIPLVIEMHDPDFRKRAFFQKPVFFLEKIVLKNVTALVTVSKKLKFYYLDLLKNSRVNIKVIYGGADIKIFTPDSTPSTELDNIKKRKQILVGYVGNLRYYQGIDFLINVAYKLKKHNFYFVLIGGENFEEIKRIKKRIKDKNIEEQIIILGKRKYEEIPSLLKLIDILVIPRPLLPITEYAFPSKLTEYMAMAKPVITTDIGDAKEIIKNQDNGILISARNIEQNLEEQLLFLKRNINLREKLGKNARQYVKDNLTWDQLTNELVLFLKKIISNYGK